MEPLIQNLPYSLERPEKRPFASVRWVALLWNAGCNKSFWHEGSQAENEVNTQRRREGKGRSRERAETLQRLAAGRGGQRGLDAGCGPPRAPSPTRGRLHSSTGGSQGEGTGWEAPVGCSPASAVPDPGFVCLLEPWSETKV